MESNKPYTWEEIKSVLAVLLKKTKHIYTFGTIGSCNVNHDIDVFITKKPTSKTSSFYKEIHYIFEYINNYLIRKYNCKLYRFAKSEEQFAVENLSHNKDDLFFHTMIGFSLPQIKSDLTAYLFPGQTVMQTFLKEYNCILGKQEHLLKKEFQKLSYYNNLYSYLYKLDKINSHYPEPLLIKAMNHYFEYIFKKRLNLKSPVTKNKKQVKKYFYKMCNIIDKLDKKRPIKPKHKSLTIQIKINLEDNIPLTISQTQP